MFYNYLNFGSYIKVLTKVNIFCESVLNHQVAKKGRRANNDRSSGTELGGLEDTLNDPSQEALEYGSSGQASDNCHQISNYIKQHCHCM